MAKLYLKNEVFTVSGSDTGINGPTEVYGTTWGFGTSTAGAFQGEDVRLSETAKNVKIDANIEKIEFTGQLSDYNFYYENSSGSQGTLSYVPAHLQITHNSIVQTVSIASINQPVKLLFSEGSYNLTQTGKAEFKINGQNATPITINNTPGGSSWSDSISPFSEKSTIQPTIKPSNITLPNTHTNAVVQVESGHNITVNNFRPGDALDLFPNASISVAPDSSNNLTFKLNDGSNNETIVTLNNSVANNFNTIYNLSSFLNNGYNIISHNTLSDFSANSNFDASEAPTNLHFNITGNSLPNNIIGSKNSDTINGGGGADTINGGGGADTINLFGGGSVQIVQSMGDSSLSTFNNSNIITNNLDVIMNITSFGNLNILLTGYTGGLANADHTSNSLFNGLITPDASQENPTPTATVDLIVKYNTDLSQISNLSQPQNDNKVFEIHGTYSEQNHNFITSSSVTVPDTLLVYDGNPALNTVNPEAIVLIGVNSTHPINILPGGDALGAWLQL